MLSFNYMPNNKKNRKKGIKRVKKEPEYRTKEERPRDSKETID